jgi:hypothetical protein
MNQISKASAEPEQTAKGGERSKKEQAEEN